MPRSRRKTSTVSVIDSAESQYQSLEQKYRGLLAELERLHIDYQNCPSTEGADHLRKVERQVVEIDTKILTILKGNPALARKVQRTDPVGVSDDQLPEPDWRDKLLKDEEAMESQLFAKLRLEQERRQKEWQNAELTRLREQERKLFEVVAERQARVEDEWQMHHRSSSDPKNLQWLKEQHDLTQQQMQSGMAEIRQNLTRREAEWQEKSRQELMKALKEWREKRTRLLQRLEVDWREQEILHRERAHLHRIEAEWRLGQMEALEELAKGWRQELQAEHQEAMKQFKEAESSKWEAARKDWLQSISVHALKQLSEEIASMQKKLEAKLTESQRAWYSHQEQSLRQSLEDWLRRWAKEAEETLKKTQKQCLERIDREYRPVLEQFFSTHRAEWQSALANLKSEAQRELRSYLNTRGAEWEQRFGTQVVNQLDDRLKPLRRALKRKTYARQRRR